MNIIHFVLVREGGRTHKFYKNASVEAFDNGAVSGWVVLLDDRIIQTPGDNRVCLPSKEIALAIAAEWDLQDKKVSDMKIINLHITDPTVNYALDEPHCHCIGSSS